MSQIIQEIAQGEGWTVTQLLDEAKRLQRTLDPLYDWAWYKDTIEGRTPADALPSRLELLERHPQLEELYVIYFNPLIKKHHGGAEKYLRGQLGWSPTAVHPAHWARDDPVQVRINDWSYSVPKDVTHHVVWVPSPLFHPVLCTPPPSLPPSPPGSPAGATASALPLFPSAPGLPAKGSWEHVSRFGLYGSTGFSKEGEARLEEDRPEKEIEAFVKRRWNEQEWETLWFANPPSLQSVRGLAHFHVLARRKESAV